MNKDSKYIKESNLINIIIYILMILSFLPLFIVGAFICFIYYKGLFDSAPWIAWTFSIYTISIGLIWTAKMAYDAWIIRN